MKLVTYLEKANRGSVSYGAMAGDGIVDLRRRIGREYPDVRSLFAGGLATRDVVEVEVSGVGVLRNPIADD